MKNTSLSRRIAAILAGVLVLSCGIYMGCSEDEGGGTTGTGSSKITVDEIIFNPKSPAPGDTLRATAIVVSDTPNPGDFVVYEWTASGGVFLENDVSSVRWVAPLESNIYTLAVKATNTASSSQLSGEVFVGSPQPFIAERAGELFPVPGGTSMYYTSAPRGIDDGLIVRFKDGTTDEAVFNDNHRGDQYSFDRSRLGDAHVAREVFPPLVTVVYEDLQAKTRKTIARDNRDYSFRPSEFTSPAFSPNGQFICFQGGLLDQILPPAQGGVDTFAVFLYDVAAGTTQRATFNGNAVNDSVSNCFYPSVSTDNKHVVFVSDRQGVAVWELYALPISGTTVTPDTIADALVRLTDTGGQMASGSTIPPGAVRREWNPVSPILAVIGADNKLRLVPTDGSGARLVTAPGKVIDVRWTADGSYLATCIADDTDGGKYKIYRVTPGGDFELKWTALPGDKMSGLAPSPDGQLLVYAVQRSDVWYELLDIGGSLGRTEPVRITPAWAPGDAVDFGGTLQSLRSGWKPSSKTAYLFFLDKDTPSVKSLDLSGIGQQ